MNVVEFAATPPEFQEKIKKMQPRIQAALTSGRMQYRTYRLKRWEDGIWRIYWPFTQHCIDEDVSLVKAIQIVDNDIKNQE